MDPRDIFESLTAVERSYVTELRLAHETELQSVQSELLEEQHRHRDTTRLFGIEQLLARADRQNACSLLGMWFSQIMSVMMNLNTLRDMEVMSLWTNIIIVVVKS